MGAYDRSPGGCCCEEGWFICWTSHASPFGGLQAMDRTENRFTRSAALWDWRSGTPIPFLDGSQGDTFPTSFDGGNWTIDKNDLQTNEPVDVKHFWGWVPFPFFNEYVWVTFRKKDDPQEVALNHIVEYVGLINSRDQKLLWHRMVPYYQNTFGFSVTAPGFLFGGLIQGGGYSGEPASPQASGSSNLLGVGSAASALGQSLRLITPHYNPQTGQPDPGPASRPMMDVWTYDANGDRTLTECLWGVYTFPPNIPEFDFTPPPGQGLIGTEERVHRVASGVLNKGCGVHITNIEFWRIKGDPPLTFRQRNTPSTQKLAIVGDVSVSSNSIRVAGGTLRTTSQFPEFNWLWIDASPTHWAGILEEYRTALPSQPVDYHLFIDGQLIDTLTGPSVVNAFFFFGAPHVCHPHSEFGDGWVAVPRRVYTSKPTVGPGNVWTDGVLEDPQFPYRIVFYQNGVERWRTGKCSDAQRPRVFASNDRWVFTVGSTTGTYSPYVFTAPGGTQSQWPNLAFRHDGEQLFPYGEGLYNGDQPGLLPDFQYVFPPGGIGSPTIHPHLIGTVGHRNIVMDSDSVPMTFPADWPFPQ